MGSEYEEQTQVKRAYKVVVEKPKGLLIRSLRITRPNRSFDYLVISQHVSIFVYAVLVHL
jgi:hypothetical protein